MSQKKKKSSAPVVKQGQPAKSKPVPNPAPPRHEPHRPAEPTVKKPVSFTDFKVQAAILAVLAFVLYFNSIFNEYALDDRYLIIKNEYVQEGIAGIPKIMTTDAFDSYYRQAKAQNQLSGGRYRPLSTITFAIEQQFFGAVPAEEIDSFMAHTQTDGFIRGEAAKKLNKGVHVRHFFNVAWFALSIVVLLYFLRTIVFKDNPLVAFAAAFLFTIHPIHTEVVANLKSRDEILSMLFVCSTLIYAFKYLRDKKLPSLLLAMVSFFLAFLSKEYAIILIVLLPLAFYLFEGYTIRKSIVATLPYLVVVVAYAALRFSVVAAQAQGADEEVLNNPYLFATDAQKLASEIAVLLRYFKLLFIPYPLTYDYSYNQIPYVDFASPLVWLSMVVYGGMIAAGVWAFRTRHVLCFAIAFYLLPLMLVCNLFVNVGAPMGERFLYLSSVGFSIAAAYYIVNWLQRIKPESTGKAGMIALGTILAIPCGVMTINRNRDWKDDNTLFLKDASKSPNSALASCNAGVVYIWMTDTMQDVNAKKPYLTKSIQYLDKATSVHPTYMLPYLNRGVCYFNLGDYDKAAANWDTVKKYQPTHPFLPTYYLQLSNKYLAQGLAQGEKHQYPDAVASFRKGLQCTPTNVDLWYDLAYACFFTHNLDSTRAALDSALKLNPNYDKAKQLMGIVNNLPQMPSRQGTPR
jgi:protein O-mannosyl-transferase